MFSSRLPVRLEPNALSQAVRRARATRPLIDLTETNPTAAGISYPSALGSSLASAAAGRYAPHPRGLASAREAVAARLSPRPDPDRILLTASTSEAYALLFKLLCDPGDEVLVPQPSYPLFDLLAGLEAVVPRPYPLALHDGWSIDRARLEAAITPRTRAVLVVSPNNPTGSMTAAADRDWLAAVAAARGLAIVADEVFADYLLVPRDGAVSWSGESRALTFVLGGLSKAIGLPHYKLAWTTVSGPAPLVVEAIERLDVIADTYLSVATPVQAALPDLFLHGAAVHAQIAARIRQNLAALRAAASAAPAVTVLDPEGGWSVVLRVPAVRSEEQIVLDALARGVIVHPGYFFDFEREAFVVVSLLPDPAAFARGAALLVESVAAAVTT